MTKSEFMLFCKHPAWMWLKKHDPTDLPPIDDATQAMFDTGHNFEKYAEAQFAGAVALGFTNSAEYMSLPARTQDAIDAGAKTVFQGRFEYDDLTFICDILNVIDGKTVDLYEIKSSTKAKPEHIVDLAFQTIVLQGLGYIVRNKAVMHVNNKYTRNGAVDPYAITATTDVTKDVDDSIESVKTKILLAKTVADNPEMPDISPKSASNKDFGEWLDIYKFLANPLTGSIYDLCGLNPSIVAKLESQQIKRIIDIPADFKLSPKQKLQVEATKTGEPIINKQKISEFLAGLKYPLYFLDYETMNCLVPPFDGLKPYQQMPVQYSLHIIREPGGKLEHKEYLHTKNSNPAEPLVKQLLQDIGNNGSILVWYQSFEKSRNKELGELLPEYKDKMAAINDRVVDLMIPFKELWYVDAGFNGSASIKNVLPVLAPDLSYKDLTIQEGASAQRIWTQTVLEANNPELKDQIMADLLAYCKLDTLAMVKIYLKLQQTIET